MIENIMILFYPSTFFCAVLLVVMKIDDNSCASLFDL